MKLAFGAIRPCNTPSLSKCTVNSNQYYSSISGTPNHKSFTFPQFEISCSSLKHDSSRRSVGAAPHSVKLGKRWMEFQGINNWDGLLDPLDDNLRREILRYGKFVEAAYRSFDFDPSSPTYATCLHPRNSLFSRTGVGETGYKITKYLRATCGVKLPRWFHKAHPNWVSTQSSWIGYVAVCQDKKEIARLGRRDVVIAYRGTATCLEWLENLRATLTELPNHNAVPNEDGPMVESGFLSLYTSRTDTCPSLQETVREEIAKVIETYGEDEVPLSFTITGHSLGAALATLTAYDLTTANEKSPFVTVISFGGPRVGNKDFRSHLEESGSRILRIVNSDDVITKLPGIVLKDCEMAKRQGVHVDGLPGWLQRCVEEMQWVYADVGQELRVSSRECPHHVIKKGDMATCHDLKTYLHLVNGFVSSTCPFRATAQT